MEAMRMERTLTESVEDYLQDIFLLSLDRKIVRLRDIAIKRGVKMPSVVNAIKILSENRLVEHERYGYVLLTDAGVELARQIYERHETIYKFLHDVLKVKEEIAEEDAHKMEHDLHNETLESLAKFTVTIQKSKLPQEHRGTENISASKKQ
ncbi:MAG: metal-dependent transcriptional regulator [Thermotogae bacterium]|nr:metal-dependent transcriptional regulator [Thermotogota bacterium]